MNNKIKLSQASMIVTLGILLSLITTYVPILSVLSLLIPIPYAMIGTLTDNKYSVLSLITTFFILLFSVNLIYATSICIMSALPGIAIGSFARQLQKEENANKFEPVYMGTIVVVICTIVFFVISNVFFGTNILEDMKNMINETMSIQMDILKSSGIELAQNIKVDDFVQFMFNMIPTMLFLQGILISFIIYYLEIVILRRIRKTKLQLPNVVEFYLPGNAVTISLILYLLVLFIDIIGIKIHTDLIIINLQMVFNFMFIIQGIAVAIYYAKQWFKQNQSKKVFISGVLLYMTGFLGISLVGMLDSVIDFRKVRNI